MLLPIIVIVLVSIGIYLAYQKNMSNENKIIIAIIAVLCFNLAYIYLKKTTITQNETFVDMDNSISTDDGTYDIEESSPDYNEIDDVDITNIIDLEHSLPSKKNELKQKENYDNIITDETDETVDEYEKPIKTIQNTINNINYKDRVQALQKGLDRLNKNSNNSTLTPTPVPTLGMLINESFTDSGSPNTSIGQSGVEGTGNIFNPQIIIKTHNDGGQSVEYGNSPGNTTKSIYSKSPHWQTPSSDIWASGNAEHSIPTITRQPTQTPNSHYYNDSNDSHGMEQIQNKISNDYNNAYANRRTCGQYNPPQDNNGSNYPYAKRTDDMSRKYYPGYSFTPPNSWDIPQKRPPVCLPEKERFNPSGIFDRGTPTNVLELMPDGDMCMSEAECSLTNIGSIMPKFQYEEFRDY